MLEKRCEIICTRCYREDAIEVLPDEDAIEVVQDAIEKIKVLLELV